MCQFSRTTRGFDEIFVELVSRAMDIMNYSKQEDQAILRSLLLVQHCHHWCP